MNCQLFKSKFDDYLDGFLDADEMQSIERHAEVCSRCADVIAQEHRLRRGLQGLSVPPSSPGFTARALRNARVSYKASSSRRMIGAGLAATLMIGIAIGHFGSQEPAPGQLAQIQLQVNEPRNLSLAFNAPRNFDGATFVMALPPGVELVNFPGQREIIWQADLKAGRNLLTLPLLAKNNLGGEVVAEIRHGKEIKKFVLQVGVGTG